MLPPELTELLGRQYRLISHHQLRELVPDPLERREVRARLDVEPLTTRVLGQPIHEPGPGRRLTTEVLDAGRGGLLWSKTAVTWWGFGRFRLSPIHVGRLRCNSRPPTGSGAESRFEEILPGRTLAQLRRQVSVYDHSPIGVVDFEPVPWPLVIEINGEQWHSSWTDRQDDDRHYTRLLDKGHSVLVLWQYDGVARR